MALTLKVPYSAEEEAKMAVAALRKHGDLLSGHDSDEEDLTDRRAQRARMLGRSASMGSVSMNSAAGLGSGISDAIGGAKAKLDELFVHWLSMPDTAELFQDLLGTIKAGKPLVVPAHTSLVASLLHRGGGGPGSGSGGGSPLRSKNSPPPRSPSRAASSVATGSGGSPNSLHFTFSSQSLLSTDGSEGGTRGSPTNAHAGLALSPPHSAAAARRRAGGASGALSPPAAGVAHPGSPSDTSSESADADGAGASSPAATTSAVASTPAASPSTPPRPPGAGGPRPVSPPPPGRATAPRSPTAPATPASAALIPQFYFPGAGGRGRGKAMPGETLPEKLDLIVEVFRAAQEGRPAELQAPPAAVGGADEGSDSKLETVCGVTVKRGDADIALRVDQFPAVAKTLCGFPSFFAAPLFRRIKKLYGLSDTGTAGAADGSGEGKPGDGKEAGSAAAGSNGGKAKASGDDSDSDTDEDKGQVPLRVFLQYWLDEMKDYDHVDRFFRLTKQPEAQNIVKSDLLPLMEELLAFHPGLAFLESTPEFQEKYARTVIARMFYKLDMTNRGCITQRALRRSNLIAAFQHVDMEEDINLVNEYFSYEHFYVLYCKFWELDSDHDFLLSRDDLDAVGNHSLTKPILDRVFAQAGRTFECTEPGKMGYEDFVCFLMSEEDKTNEASIRYWFRVIDLDSDGVIRPSEMRHFYADQMQRMEDMNCEVVPFEDVLCQMSDLLQPDVEGEFRLKDFLHPTRVRLTGVFFSILSNLSKFTAFEQRDPFVVKQQQEPGFTAWDRYAQIEYARLAMEEDAQMDDGMALDQIEEVSGVAAWDDDEDLGDGGMVQRRGNQSY